MLRTARFFLLRVDPAGDGVGRPLIVGQIEILDDALDQPYLIAGIQNLEVLRQAGFLPVHPQHAMRDAVKGADRSEERGVGKECVSTCRSRWSPLHEKKKHKK